MIRTQGSRVMRVNSTSVPFSPLKDNLRRTHAQNNSSSFEAKIIFNTKKYFEMQSYQLMTCEQVAWSCCSYVRRKWPSCSSKKLERFAWQNCRKSLLAFSEVSLKAVKTTYANFFEECEFLFLFYSHKIKWKLLFVKILEYQLIFLKPDQ